MKNRLARAVALAIAVCAVFAADSGAGGENRFGEGQWSLGAALAFSVTPYKSYDRQYLPAPLLGYSGSRFYIGGMGAGVHVLKNENHEVSVGVSYSAFQFRPGKTDARELKVLDKRRSTVMADASYLLTTGFGQFRFKGSRDVLGHSDGYVADVLFRLPIIRTDAFGLYPGVGVEWSSDRQNDYYYGVSRSEAARGTVEYYKAKNSFSPYLSLEAKYVVSECVEIFAGGRLDFLDSRVKDSPMVDRSYKASFAFGAAYKF